MTLSADTLVMGYPGRRSVLHGVSMDARPGRVLALVGANASGKSTLLRGLAGLLAPESGTVQLGGESIRGMAPARRAALVGWMPQRPSIAGRFTVREVVTIGRFARPRDPDAVPDLPQRGDLHQTRDRRRDHCQSQSRSASARQSLAWDVSDAKAHLKSTALPLGTHSLPHHREAQETHQTTDVPKFAQHHFALQHHGSQGNTPQQIPPRHQQHRQSGMAAGWTKKQPQLISLCPTLTVKQPQTADGPWNQLLALPATPRR